MAKILKIGVPAAILIAGVLAAALFWNGPEPDGEAVAGETVSGSAGQSGPDMVMGSADAPVLVIEYASMSCPHCALFHEQTFPDLKEHYIQTGKVRYIFRDYPINRPALEGAMVARCAGPERYFAFLKMLLAKQSQWAASKDSIDKIKGIVKMGGMTSETVDRCLADEKLKKQILGMRMTGEREHQVTSTPTFIVNGEKHTGVLSFAEFEKILKPLLAE